MAAGSKTLDRLPNFETMHRLNFPVYSSNFSPAAPTDDYMDEKEYWKCEAGNEMDPPHDRAIHFSAAIIEQETGGRQDQQDACEDRSGTSILFPFPGALDVENEDATQHDETQESRCAMHNQAPSLPWMDFRPEFTFDLKELVKNSPCHARQEQYSERQDKPEPLARVESEGIGSSTCLRF